MIHLFLLCAQMKPSFFSPKPLLLITKIFFFLIAALTSQSIDDKYYSECSTPYTCGSNTEIKYPFRGSGRPSCCGVQGYEVKCEENNIYPIFETSSQAFNVLNINRSSRVMTIVRVDLFDDLCTQNFNDTALNVSLVNYVPGTQNISLFYSCQSGVLDTVGERETFKCGETGGISLNALTSNAIWSQASEECEKNITVPVMGENLVEFDNETISLLDLVKRGFEVNYELQQGTADSCHNCENSGGICGTNTTEQFTCFCKDGFRFDSCPNQGTSFWRSETTTVIIGICSVIGSLLLIIGFWCFRKVTKNEITKRRKEKFFEQNGGLLLHQQLLSGDGNIRKIKVFKSYELEKATNQYNVDRVLGQGGQGTVYKGILSDGMLVAVKKSKIVDTKNVGQFINEVVILSQINHRNIVKLLGCCLETEVPMLVYEFISNGTLFEQIHNPKKELNLNWEMRLRIAAEIAGTISYLHNAAPVPIYHRDIKSTNILLDDKFKAKVVDFGISRSVDFDVSHLTTQVRGTFGYLDPEYYQLNRFTEKSDVYSFGVVLVELLTGQKPILSDPFEEYKALASHFMESMEENHFREMIDPQLCKKDKIQEMVEVAHLAKACLNSIGKRRPTMKEIVVQLDGIFKMSREKNRAQENVEIDVGEAYDDYSTRMEAWDESSTSSSSLNADINSLLDA